MERVDTLIVGGGPTGTMCGIRLRQAGKDCLLVEKAHYPRMKLCAGVLTRKSRDVLSEVFPKESCKALIMNTQMSHESHLRLWEGKECFVDCDFSDKLQIPKQYRDDDWRFVLVDRPSFDTALFDYYTFLDGESIEGDALKTVDFENKVAVFSSGKEVGYNRLVACDGANSHIEQLLVRHDKAFKAKGKNAEAFEINVDREDLDIDGINVCFGYVPKTYAWAFAKGKKICLGTCRLNGCRFSAKEAMRKFCNDLGLKHQEKYPLQGAMIPFDNAMPVPLWHDSVYFCGDAAGLDEAVTGEGIFYALRSGVDAAESIIQGNPLLYLDRNLYLQKLMAKAARYQKVLEKPWLYRLFHWFTKHDNRFVGYFYLTQIDHASLHRFPYIYGHYLTSRL